MAHFYGIIDSHGRSKTDATRQGSKDRGMSGYVSGWDIGGKIVLGHSSLTDLDWCDIYATGGSNSTSGPKLARLIEDKYGKPKIYVNWHLDKLLDEEEYTQMKKDIGALISEGSLKKARPHEKTCHAIAEAIMDQLNFKLDDPKPEED
jgi:hypothetical protein